jgi:hypothetical protein
MAQGETANRALCRAGGRCEYMYWNENCQGLRMSRAGPKNAIFDLSMPSQIRWAVSWVRPKLRHRLTQSELR